VYQHPSPHEHNYVILYLHGVHQSPLRDKPAFTEQFDKHGLHVVCPVTGPTWWTDRLCPQFDSEMTVQAYLLERVLPLIDERFGTGPPGIGLLGTSMGGQGALRLAYKFPDIFPVVAAISPAIDYQIRLQEGDEVLAQMYPNAEAVRQDTALLHIHPLNWPRHQFFCCDPADTRWYDSVDRLHMKLASIGVPHEHDLQTSGGGHGFEYYNVMAEKAVTFLFDGLERERRRIV
jgi:S-formylglutathione hydrolase FrmB